MTAPTDAKRAQDAARIAAADALVSTLLDFPTVHLERVYDLAEAYRATARANVPEVQP